MDILNSQNVIQIKGRRIPLLPIGAPKLPLRVTTIEDEIIPGMTEKIIDAFVGRPLDEYNVNIEENMMLEENPKFCEKYGCKVAPVVIRVTGRVTVQVRLFNIFSRSYSVEV